MQHSVIVRQAMQLAIARGFVANPPPPPLDPRAARRSYLGWAIRNTSIVRGAVKDAGVYVIFHRRGDDVPPALLVRDRSIVLTRVGFSDPPPARTMVGTALGSALDYLIDGKHLGAVPDPAQLWEALFKRQTAVSDITKDGLRNWSLPNMKRPEGL